MGIDDLKKIQDRMKTGEKAKESPNPPADGGSVSGDAQGNQDTPSREGAKHPGVRKDVKSMPEKQKVAEEITRDAKLRDVEDGREETSDPENRRDLVIPTQPNIPPTIVQERLRLGQNPTTGEPWSAEERRRYDQEQDEGVRKHSRAVAESEQKMRQEQAERQANPPVQPVSHVPVSQLTKEQKDAMQKAQDEGKGPVAQAQARDQATPLEQGRRDAAMATQKQERDDAGVDEDIERQELGEDADDIDDDDNGEQDPDEIENDLNK